MLTSSHQCGFLKEKQILSYILLSVHLCSAYVIPDLRRAFVGLEGGLG